MVTLSNPTKYLGNELEYLKRVLEGESWSATGGGWTNTLEKEFAKVINRNSVENWNNTPDFILAKYLIDCLKVFSDINRNREQWYGKELKII